MLNWIRRQFRQTEIKTLPLSFSMDRTDDGQHLVRVWKDLGDEQIPVTDPLTLSQYGYQEKEVLSERDVMFVVEERDRQTLFSLNSLNPRVTADGSMYFDFAPPILSYLRTKDNIEESLPSQQLKVSNDALEAIVEIDYIPNEGVAVKPGYHDPETGGFVRKEDLAATSDGQHVLIGNTFMPVPVPPSEEAKKWWEQSTTNIPKQNIPEFFLRDLVLLMEDFTAVLTDSASDIQVITEPFKPVIRVDQTQPGWLEFDVGYEVDGRTISHETAQEAAGKPFIQLDEHTWVMNEPKVVEQTEKRLQELEAEITKHGYKTPASQFASLEDFIDSIGGKAQASAAYKAFLNQLTGFAADDTFKLSPGAERQFERLGMTLRPYQRAGIHWLDWLHANHLHGLLADDMGLGKTLQSICVLRGAYERTRSRQHSLILSPKSVIQHWVREIEKYYPSIRIYPYHGPNRNRRLLHALEPVVFITTYQTAANDIEELKKIPFFYVILDEATRIKNPQAKRTQATKALNSAHRIALSGTPVENRPSEMWSIFDFLMRGHLGRFGTFRRVFENEISAGNRKAADRLGKRVKPFMLRRMKEDVAKDLPDKIEMDEWCELTDEQRQLYGQLQSATNRICDSIRRGEQVNYTSNILPILMKLKQICDHPAIVLGQKKPLHGRSEKFDWIIDKIQEIEGQGEQVVTFSHFLSMLNLLENALKERKISYIRIDGSVSNRQELIDRFNAGRDTVALCSIGATSHGINLTSANHVIHADRWWNPAVEDQATDRVHRIGQDKTVYVYRIMVEGTLEERIDTLLANKRQIAGQIIDAAAIGARQWTREELLELLRPLD